VACDTTIRTTAGRSLTPPRIRIPDAPPLVRQLAKQLSDAWTSGGDFNSLAALLLDKVCDHIRSTPYTELYPPIADAIEDHLSTELPEGDTAEAGEVAPEHLPGYVSIDEPTPVTAHRIEFTHHNEVHTLARSLNRRGAL
jgi:hypothetical protein